MTDMEVEQLFDAIIQNDQEAVRSILNEGRVSVNCNQILEKNDTPLTCFLEHWSDETEFVDYLLGIGAHVNKSNSRGWTPLMYATRHSGLKTMMLLVNKYHAIVDKQDNDGSTALCIAIKNHCLLPVVRFLVEEGKANINHTEIDHFAPLGLASIQSKENLEIVDYLLSCENIDLTAWGPLEAAAYFQNTNIIKRLLKGGVPVTNSVLLEVCSVGLDPQLTERMLLSMKTELLIRLILFGLDQRYREEALEVVAISEKTKRNRDMNIALLFVYTKPRHFGIWRIFDIGRYCWLHRYAKKWMSQQRELRQCDVGMDIVGADWALKGIRGLTDIVASYCDTPTFVDAINVLSKYFEETEVFEESCPYPFDICMPELFLGKSGC